MHILFRCILTVSATFWMVIVYGFNQGWTLFSAVSNLFPKLREIINSIPVLLTVTNCKWVLAGLLVGVIMFLSRLVIWLSKWAGGEDELECKEISLADNSFLPVYLGYFFVSLSIGDIETMTLIYLLIFVFTYKSQTQYFNPAFLLMGYHFYDVSTKQGTRIFVIHKGAVIKNPNQILFENLKRINDTTFIERR